MAFHPPDSSISPISMKRSNIKRVSSKRSKEQREYKRLNIAYMTDNPICEVVDQDGVKCSQRATELHHRKGRYQFYLDTKTFMACCKAHHNHIHENGEWSKERGYLINPSSIHPTLPLEEY